jgi:hypothetical protein
LSLKENLLKFPDFSSSWKRGRCKECSIFYIVDDILLHLAFLRGSSLVPSSTDLETRVESNNVVQSTLGSDRQYQDINVFDKQDIRTEGLDESFSSLLCNLRNMQPGSPVSMEMLNLTCVILRFDPVEAASKIQSISDAQACVDFMLHVSDGVYHKRRCSASW